MSKHKFALPEERFLVVGDGPLAFFVTRDQAKRHVEAGGRWAGKVRCHNNGELHLIDSDGKCECCRAGGQCELFLAKVIEVSSDPVERWHKEQLASALQSVSLEERRRLDELIWSEAIVNFITAVRILCAPPMGTMPDGTIRAGVILGPPPRPGDVPSLDWTKKQPIKSLIEQRHHDGDGAIPDADVVLRDLTKQAKLATDKLRYCLNTAFDEEPWAIHVEWYYRTLIENVLRAAHAVLKPKEDYSPETIEAAASKSPGNRQRRVTSHSRRRTNPESPDS